VCKVFRVLLVHKGHQEYKAFKVQLVAKEYKVH
jgi:hypothetical protein